MKALFMRFNRQRNAKDFLITLALLGLFCIFIKYRTGEYTIQGVSLGMSRVSVEKILGSPSSHQTSTYGVYRGTALVRVDVKYSGDVATKFRCLGHVGSSGHLGVLLPNCSEDTILHCGENRAKIESFLGAPTHTKDGYTQYAPRQTVAIEIQYNETGAVESLGGSGLQVEKGWTTVLPNPSEEEIFKALGPGEKKAEGIIYKSHGGILIFSLAENMVTVSLTKEK